VGVAVQQKCIDNTKEIMTKFFNYLFIFTIFIANPLQAKKPTYLSYQEEKDGVTLAIKELSPKESQKKLSSGAFKSRKKPSSIIPVTCTITNNSKRDIKFRKSDIGLKLVLPRLIKNKLELQSRIIAYGGWLFFLSTLIIAEVIAFGALFGNPASGVLLYSFGPQIFVMLALEIAIMTALVSLPFIPIYKKSKSLVKKSVISYESLMCINLEPGESAEFTFYVRKKNLPKTFKMAVQDAVSKKKTYFTVSV
jgi:hypothetical protein